MSQKKEALGKGLGKGINLVIPEGYVEENKRDDDGLQAEKMVKLRLIESAPNQPRKNFDEDALEELADSIANYGMIQPIIVKKVEDHYQIIAGERRWRAAKKAGLKEVPVIVRDFDEQKMAEVALIENLQREDLNPIEEARAFQALIDEYGLKQDEIAGRVSKSRTVITNALRLLKLDERIQDMLSEGSITTGHAKVILGLDDTNLQVEAANRVVEEQLSVRATEKLVKELAKPKPQVEKKELSNAYLYDEIRQKMEKRLGTRVKIKRQDDNKGKVEIEYYNNSDLERIIEAMNINE